MADRFPNTDGTWLALASMGLLTLAGSAELGSRNDKQIPVVYLAGTSVSDIPNLDQWDSWVNFSEDYDGERRRYSDAFFGDADAYWASQYKKLGYRRVSHGKASRNADGSDHPRIRVFTPDGDLPKGTRIGNVGPRDSIRTVATLSGKGMTYVEAQMGNTIYRITADLLSPQDRVRLRTIYLREKNGSPDDFEDDKHMAALEALVNRLCEVQAGTALPLHSWGLTLEDERRYLMDEIGWLRNHVHRVDSGVNPRGGITYYG